MIKKINVNGVEHSIDYESLANKPTFAQLYRYESFSKFPATGVTNAIYIDLSTSRSYYWADFYVLMAGGSGATVTYDATNETITI